MKARSHCLLLCCLLIGFDRCDAFTQTASFFVGSKTPLEYPTRRRRAIALSSGAENNNGKDSETATESNVKAKDSLKRSLLQLGASYDRGYGATASARQQVNDLISDLEKLNMETDASRGSSGATDQRTTESPLKGMWRMVWTTAQDVLVLGASPIATIGAIYQVFDPPLVTNIIDFIPRAQSLLPPTVAPSSLLRAEVTTRASPRTNQPMRISLDFEKVTVKPIELLGMDVGGVLPPFGFDLPRLPGIDPETSPGYFDVTYLDADMVIIQQNSPGGTFVLVKVSSMDP